MRMIKTISFIILAISGSAFGQTEKLLVPSDLKQQTIVTEPVTLRKGYLRTGMLFNYRVADRYFDDSKAKQYYETSIWSSKSSYGLTMQYGLSDRFEIDLMLEYINKLQQSSSTETSSVTNLTTTTVSKQKGIGLGDSHLGLLFQIIPEKERKISLTTSLDATFPTGKKNPANIKNENQYDLPVGDGTYSLGMSLIMRKVAYPYSFNGSIEYIFNFPGSKIISTTNPIETGFKFGNHFETGFTTDLHLNEWIVLANNINFYHEGEGTVKTQKPAVIPVSWAFSYEPGLIFQVYRFRLGESVKIPVWGRNVPADQLYMIFAQYIF